MHKMSHLFADTNINIQMQITKNKLTNQHN